MNEINFEPSSPETDQMVSAWVLAQYRESYKPNEHLVGCPDAFVQFDAYNGAYGCDTGCEYARLEADISCRHGQSAEWFYGEFGEIADVLKEIEDWNRGEDLKRQREEWLRNRAAPVD